MTVTCSRRVSRDSWLELGPTWASEGSIPVPEWEMPPLSWSLLRVVDGDGGWEARMGFHHVLEVSERIVEFCEDDGDEREA